jgi:hypothetical protein
MLKSSVLKAIKQMHCLLMNSLSLSPTTLPHQMCHQIPLCDTLCSGVQPMGYQLLCVKGQVTVVSVLVAWTITRALNSYRQLVKPKLSLGRSMPSKGVCHEILEANPSVPSQWLQDKWK